MARVLLIYPTHHPSLCATQACFLNAACIPVHLAANPTAEAMSDGHTIPVSLVPVLDDLQTDSMSDVAMSASFTGIDESSSGRVSPAPSDRESLYSYMSSVDREFILKDVHGRVFNNTNEVKTVTFRDQTRFILN